MVVNSFDMQMDEFHLNIFILNYLDCRITICYENNIGNRRFWMDYLTNHFCGGSSVFSTAFLLGHALLANF